MSFQIGPYLLIQFTQRDRDIYQAASASAYDVYVLRPSRVLGNTNNPLYLSGILNVNIALPNVFVPARFAPCSIAVCTIFE